MPARSSSAARTTRSRRSERGAEVVAYSSGNHAQAVALARSLLGAHATILMPEDAPGLEARGDARATAPRSSRYDRYTERPRGDRLPRSRAERGAELVPSVRRSADHGRRRERQRSSCVEDAGVVDTLVVPRRRRRADRGLRHDREGPRCPAGRRRRAGGRRRLAAVVRRRAARGDRRAADDRRRAADNAPGDAHVGGRARGSSTRSSPSPTRRSSRRCGLRSSG